MRGVYGATSTIETPFSAPYIASLSDGGVLIDVTVSFSVNTFAAHRTEWMRHELTFDPTGRVSVKRC